MKASKTVKRLKRAQKILSSVPEDRFTQGLEKWLSREDGRRIPDLPGNSLPEPNCQTLACGMGWLALHPKFLTKEFRMSLQNGILVFHERNSRQRETDGFGAAETFFGIDGDEAYKLFGPWEVAIGEEKKTLMKRLDGFIEKYSEPA